jgi:hypothetical protein
VLVEIGARTDGGASMGSGVRIGVGDLFKFMSVMFVNFTFFVLIDASASVSLVVE